MDGEIFWFGSHWFSLLSFLLFFCGVFYVQALKSPLPSRCNYHHHYQQQHLFPNRHWETITNSRRTSTTANFVRNGQDDNYSGTNDDEDVDLLLRRLPIQEPSHPRRKVKNPLTNRWIQVTPVWFPGDQEHHQVGGDGGNKRKRSVWNSIMQQGGWMAYKRELVALFLNKTETVSTQKVHASSPSQGGFDTWYFLEPTLEEPVGKTAGPPPQKMQNQELPLANELLWVYKPDGLLTLPGKNESDCLAEQVHQYLLSTTSSPSNKNETVASTTASSFVSSQPANPNNKQRRKRNKKRKYEKPWIPRPCHRLDKDTSGIIVIAKTRDAYKALSQQFHDRLVQKRYVALVEGSLTKTAADSHKDSSNNNIEPNMKTDSLAGKKGGVIDLPIGSLSVQQQCLLDNNIPLPKDEEELRHQHHHKVWSTHPLAENARPALTQWRISQEYYSSASPSTSNDENSYTRMVLYPKTGRGHQLRLHMAEGLGHAILGDTLHHSPSSSVTTTTLAPPRLCLHAEYLEFWVLDETDGKPKKAKCWCLPPF